MPNPKAILNWIADEAIVGPVAPHYQEIRRSHLQPLTQKYLARLTDYAVHHIPYYSRRLKHPYSFAALPLLTKSLIRHHRQELETSSHLPGRFLNSSGGSTGKPVTLVQDREYNSWTRATEKYYFEVFLGVEYPTTPKVVLWGSDRDALRQSNLKGRFHNYLTNTAFLNTFKADESTWLAYADVINHKQPVYIKGYAGSLYQLARMIRQHNLKIWSPRFLFSSAEMLRDFMRREIEAGFLAPVFDFFCSR